MNAFSDIHEILTAFLDSLPWAVVMVDERSAVTYLNRKMRDSGAAPSAPAGAPLAAMFPQYHAALRGEVAWLTPQAAVVTRDEQGSVVTERIALHRLPLGAAPRAPLGWTELLVSSGFAGVWGLCHAWFASTFPIVSPRLLEKMELEGTGHH